MVQYTKTKAVLLKLPEGVYDEILRIMNKESKWLTPQDFIKESIRDKINKIKKENPRLFDR